MANDSTSTVVQLRGVTKTFRDFWMRPRVTAVRDLDLTIGRGEVLGLLGPNGSGKSTTIKMILGLLFPTRGQIAVFGQAPTEVSLKRRIGYLPEESNLFRFLNGNETLDFYARLFRQASGERRRRAEMLLEMVGLEGAQYRPVGEYSKGMQRRIGLAQALINDPDLLILDEPTTGMDPIATSKIKELIRYLHSRGKTILMCTHLLGEVEDVCTRLVIMYGGRTRAQGTVEELLARKDCQTIETGPLRPETIARIDSLLIAEEGAGIRKVETPRQRLESLFLNVVEEAEKEGLVTSGATAGGRVAEFLGGAQPAPAGQALDLGALVSGSPPAPSAPAAAGPAREPEPEPDLALLERIAAGAAPGPAPAEPAAPPAAPAPAADTELLEGLTRDEGEARR